MNQVKQNDDSCNCVRLIVIKSLLKDHDHGPNQSRENCQNDRKQKEEQEAHVKNVGGAHIVVLENAVEI